MTWWFKSHYALLLMGTVIGCTILTIFLGSWGFLFPSIGGTTPFGSVPLVAVLPLISAIVLALCLTAGAPATYEVAARRILFGDAALALAVVIVPTLAYGAIALAGQPADVAAAGARNTLGYVSLQLVASRFLGYRLQAIIPVLYLFVASVFGREAGNVVAFWAWPIGSGSDAGYWIIPILLALVAVFVAASRAGKGLMGARLGGAHSD